MLMHTQFEVRIRILPTTNQPMGLHSVYQLKRHGCKGGIGGSEQVSARSAVHMAAALASYRKALVGTDWTISHLVSTNRLPSPCRGTISGLV